jgi:topoisomerase IA-like protein
MKQIIITESVAGLSDGESFAYTNGDVVSVTDALAADLIAAGHAKAAQTKAASSKREKRTVKAPETR